jgi:MoaA/NifB/PqqE/SkfB family radical SAM enzyme
MAAADPKDIWLSQKIPLTYDGEKLERWASQEVGPVVYFKLGLTFRCQLRCRHCCSANYPWADRSELTTEEVKDILDQTWKPLVVHFFGGEPTLRSDLVELIDYAAERSIFVFFDTNGLLISKEYAERLRGSGLELLHVSVDSPVPRKHDEYRGMEGCFEKAIQGVRNALDAGLKCAISTYVTRESLENGEFEGTIELGRELGVTGVRYQLATPSGRWLHNVEVKLTPAEETRLRDLVDFPFVFRDFHFQNQASNQCRGMADGQYAYVSPIGEVQPCSFVPLSFGNVREEPVKTIFERMWKHPMFGESCLSEECPMLSDEFCERYIETIPGDADLPFRMARMTA